MTRLSRQNAPEALVVVLAAAALIATVMLITGLWSGSRLTSRMTAVNLRLDPPVEKTQEDKKPDQQKAEDPGAPQAMPPGHPEQPGQPGNNQPEDKSEQKNLAPPALAVARIKAKNMFMTPVKPDFRNILGILGNRVLYPGDISLAVGEVHNGATIKEIGSNWVKVEYEGEIIPLGVYGGTPPPEPQKDTKKEDNKEAKDETKAESDSNSNTKDNTKPDQPQPEPQEAPKTAVTSKTAEKETTTSK